MSSMGELTGSWFSSGVISVLYLSSELSFAFAQSKWRKRSRIH